MEAVEISHVKEVASISQMDKFPRFIAIEGSVCVGKTALARRLATTFHYDLLLEDNPQDDPSFNLFYRHSKDSVLNDQLYFPFRCASQLQSICKNDSLGSVRISDFCVEKDLLFAEMYLSVDEMKLYNRAYKMRTKDLPIPDLVIYLQAPVGTLKERIREKGAEAKKTMGRGYLKRLNEAYEELFHYYDQSPLLIINVSEIDFVHSEQDYRQLVEEIMSCRKGRQYLNPKPSEV
ncbi:MAG: deoxynucleoside kinase [Endozoicomonadaceae bacterium]|nr:deoxynucleoside kinase [Endozoicomonadaceae bacterium]